MILSWQVLYNSRFSANEPYVTNAANGQKISERGKFNGYSFFNTGDVVEIPDAKLRVEVHGMSLLRHAETGSPQALVIDATWTNLGGAPVDPRNLRLWYPQGMLQEEFYSDPQGSTAKAPEPALNLSGLPVGVPTRGNIAFSIPDKPEEAYLILTQSPDHLMDINTVLIRGTLSSKP